MERWWQNAISPIRRVWIRVANRIGIRKNGLLKLRHEIRTCEYEDVHVMWEMLQRTEAEVQGQAQANKSKGPFWKMFVWASRTPYLCRAY
ncbi:hypothetical protein CKAN_00104300 [Cinnamomum micranthum f. kanehirae]|uniref:Uncharacterized protein n=1 Tax=Cinnamomum micranthum f. kanehirae TaxID=337451 RepID=A0A3S3NPS8_9MAGN|nr:hypothetical protein CKAN_00104300 [Cinnamomum micranthum f. kanehirae]